MSPPSKGKSSSPERLATLEAQFQAFMETQDERHAENQQRMKDLQAAQHTLQHALARYTGFWGALLLVGGFITTILTLFGSLLRKKLGWE